MLVLTSSWQELKVGSETFISTGRTGGLNFYEAELSKEAVGELIVHLKAWLETGSLELKDQPF